MLRIKSAQTAFEQAGQEELSGFPRQLGLVTGALSGIQSDLETAIRHLEEGRAEDAMSSLKKIRSHIIRVMNDLEASEAGFASRRIWGEPPLSQMGVPAVSPEEETEMRRDLFEKRNRS